MPFTKLESAPTAKLLDLLFSSLGREAIAKLKLAAYNEGEAAHLQADLVLLDLLKSLGYDNVVDEFEKASKRWT